MRNARPSIILSKKRLLDAWKNSRDATSDPGRPGIDELTAAQFQSKLETNIASLAKTIKQGQYGPSRLRAVLIPKPDSSSRRLICIPTVRDRIVQRTIIEYLNRTGRLPNSPNSFAFIRDKGSGPAVSRAIELRSVYDWCLKTDIKAFFDRIDRNDLKGRLDRSLPRCSLSPLIKKFIDCEISTTGSIKYELAKQGVKPGVGLRQGMPLSPILANLALSEFDNEVEAAQIKMIRYADDLLLFFHSKQETQQGLDFIKWRLKEQGLDIPELADNSKTKIIAPGEHLDFLGRQIVRLQSGQHVWQVSRRQINKIKLQLEEEYSFESRSREKSSFQETMVDLSRSVSSYFGIYKGAHNYAVLDSELRGATRAITVALFEDVFGISVLDKVSDKGRNFLGIGDLVMPDPSSDLEEGG
jgi:RNA-directed DNA polymerase